MKISAFWRISLLYGLIGAVSCFAFVAMLDVIGTNPFGKFKNATWAIYGGMFALAMRHYSTTVKGNLQWYHGLSIGMATNLVAATTYFLLLYPSLLHTPLGASIYDDYIPELITEAQIKTDLIIAVPDSLKAQDRATYIRDSSLYHSTLLIFTDVQQKRNLSELNMAIEQAYLGYFFPLGFVLVFLFTVFSINTLKKTVAQPISPHQN